MWVHTMILIQKQGKERPRSLHFPSFIIRQYLPMDRSSMCAYLLSGTPGTLALSLSRNTQGVFLCGIEVWTSVSFFSSDSKLYWKIAKQQRSGLGKFSSSAGETLSGLRNGCQPEWVGTRSHTHTPRGLGISCLIDEVRAEQPIKYVQLSSLLHYF